MDENWVDLGSVEELAKLPLQQLMIGRTAVALSHVDGRFAAVSGTCNHAGGPLGEGRLDGEYIVCPWHNWKFHRETGEGEPGYEEDQVPRFRLEERDGHLWVDLASRTARHKKPHAKHPLTRPRVREPGPVRVLGISTTVMDRANPRYSTSDALLQAALDHARGALGVPARRIDLRELSFRACEGYYSKSAQACTWPCSITQMDPTDQMEQVYEALVFWADVVLVATPIRWGAASSLFFKMAERLNCVQNQVTLRDKVLIENKVAAFIITGGQDNVQAVAGHALLFFSELGFQFPQFPFIAHSRGWSAEDMENNLAYVRGSAELAEAARALVHRSVEHARHLLEHAAEEPLPRAGRKASGVDGHLPILRE